MHARVTRARCSVCARSRAPYAYETALSARRRRPGPLRARAGRTVPRRAAPTTTRGWGHVLASGAGSPSSFPTRKPDATTAKGRGDAFSPPRVAALRGDLCVTVFTLRPCDSSAPPRDRMRAGGAYRRHRR